MTLSERARVGVEGRLAIRRGYCVAFAVLEGEISEVVEAFMGSERGKRGYRLQIL